MSKAAVKERTYASVLTRSGDTGPTSPRGRRVALEELVATAGQEQR